MRRLVAITGVAGGIGAATAAVFRDAGWSVVGVDVMDPGPSSALDGFAVVDFGADNAEARMRGFIASQPRLDALVNAAARQETTSIDDTPPGDWDRVLAVNLRGTLLAMQAAHDQLHSSHGAIVNVASVHAFASSHGVAAYAASKAGMVALTRGAALEWAPEVRVNAVLPGAVDTPMLRLGVRRWATSSEGVESALQELGARTPLGRIGRPTEIAHAILFLADAGQSSFVTGQTLVADGGALARLSTE